MWASIVIFLAIATAGGCKDRKLTTTLNPGCVTCGPETTLVYTRCDGSNDTLHQIWDFSLGKPTAIFALTDANTTLAVGWAGTRPFSFNWTSDPKYSFAVIINEIWLYNDLNDTAIWKPEWETVTWDTRNLDWQRINFTQSEDEVKLKMKADLYRRRNGSIVIDLDLRPFTDYGSLLPHLIHSANSSLMDVSLVDVSVGRFNSSRLALSILLVSTDPGSAKMDPKITKSLDDEHTPGIFEMVEITTPEASKRGDGGFIQYRPVAYTAAFREVTASTTVNLGRFNKTTSLPSGSNVELFFRECEQQDVLKEKMLVSFGGTGDGFYTRTNFTAWAFTMGYGSPPVEGFSLYVILVISIGLSIPAVLLIGGLIYALTKRTSRSHERLLD